MTVRTGQLKAAILTLCAIPLITLTACSNATEQTAPVPQANPQTSTAPTADTTGDGSDTKVRDDLRTGSVQKSFKSGSLTVNVTYSTPLPTKQWTTSGAKPLTVSLSAINNDKDLQKIYLSKVVVSVLSADQSGQLGNPSTLTDTANISPGYIVNFPYTYEQNFTIPAVDQSARSLTLTFNYELLSQVQKDTKDYTKQTASSTIKVPLS